MTEPHNNRQESEQQGFGGEISSSQLVVAICIVLVACLICFMLGIVFGRVEKTGGGEREPASVASGEKIAEPGDDGERVSTAVAGDDQGEGKQAYPRPVVLPAEEPQEDDAEVIDEPEGRKGEEPEVELPKMATASDDSTEPGDEQQPDEDTAVPAKPARGADEGQQVDDDTGDGAPDEEAAPDVDSEKPDESNEGEARSADETVDQEQKEEEETASGAAGGKPAEKPEEAETEKGDKDKGLSEATPGKGAFGVQVASFSGSKREKSAADYKRRLEANSDLKAILSHSEDDKYVRVIVGGYPDRETAEKVCKELRKRAGFSDCFVKPLE